MIPGATGFAWAVAAAAFMVGSFGDGPLAGIPRHDVAVALSFMAAAFVVTGWAAERARFGTDAIVGGVVLWGLAVGLLGATFIHRDAVLAAMRDIGAEIGTGPSEATVIGGGEVVVTRRGDGHFSVPARVNDQEVRFLFDTGASSVVLAHETARRLGLSPETLRFRVPVSTANGRALAAPVTLDRLAIGSIVVRRVPALVAQPGLLEGNLLGQTFLDRLDSYEVRGNRLVLRARPADNKG